MSDFTKQSCGGSWGLTRDDFNSRDEWLRHSASANAKPSDFGLELNTKLLGVLKDLSEGHKLYFADDAVLQDQMVAVYRVEQPVCKLSAQGIMLNGKPFPYDAVQNSKWMMYDLYDFDGAMAVVAQIQKEISELFGLEFAESNKLDCGGGNSSLSYIRISLVLT